MSFSRFKKFSHHVEHIHIMFKTQEAYSRMLCGCSMGPTPFKEDIRGLNKAKYLGNLPETSVLIQKQIRPARANSADNAAMQSSNHKPLVLVL